MAKQRSPRLTREMAATIKWLVAKEGLLQHQAAARFGINQGRVSEVMSGKRFPGIPPAMILS
ncbi:MAG: hypothetical protein Q8L94_00545 [Parvibaculum sp.]|uniref:hypothetical protein n=1 Tax=Parvibaculum sp. TaxID=2024848 RepID=UPI00272FE73F|nr:hypothetical protein [Parvibaculum sp.]MDP1625588.1 hypothetical protein [Parvibaculum sp.]